MTDHDYDAAFEWATDALKSGSFTGATKSLCRVHLDLSAERDLLRRSIERMVSAGNPNAIRGCQLIVKLGKEALAGSKDE